MLALVFALFTTLSSFSAVNDKLPNSHFPYYGHEFYQAYPKSVSKELIGKVLNSSHKANTGKYDTISEDCTNNCYNAVSLGYDSARKIMFGKLFAKNDSKGMYVEDVYCGKKFYFRDVNEAMRMNNEVNTEHTWPQSKFTGHFPRDVQKSDLHHLYPTDSEANAKRGNFSFGTVPEDEDELNMPDCEISELSKRGEIKFEPPQDHRGNVARSLFYFSTRYKMPIDAKQEATLRQWHKEDPVDAAEINRHQIISEYQKVRNPFVDYPELVDTIKDF